MGIDNLYKKQISLTEWFDNLKHSQTQKIRSEDNEKRERLRVLNEITGLPYDKPTQFQAIDVINRSEEFKKFLNEKGDEACALRLIPIEENLPKLRMRGQKIKDVSENWIKEQKIDYTKYKADFVPHPETPQFGSIFIVNSKGIFGEIIKGGHHQLTQGFYDEGKPITFSYDLKNWKFSENIPEIEEHAKTIIEMINIKEENKRNSIKEKLNGEFSNNYLQGYFETVQSKEQGIWFIDYNKTLSEIYENFFPEIENKSGDLKGITASNGEAIGKVKIVSPEEIETTKMNPDEILVCHMTTPEYFNIMQQSLGIITNEGGMLSHAGIIAREMNKPCIVGTQNATTLLKNGDKIKLNANEGTITKLT